MKKAVIYIFAILMVFVLGACSNQEVEEEPQFLEVDLTINPNKAELNKPITFEAKVTYGSEEVTDADEVNFEIWRAHDEKHEKIEVKHAENGIYRLEKSFDREGTYYIYAHVTARSMHNMPKKEFIIGEPSEPEDSSNSSKEKDKEENDHSGH
ncbi:FixH family protein [Bacillus sp. 31A1R]|uniref:FixH family protein n=1 Tax=Robertmurraya mangrovi TaxID=3098077 RepID=A0ABU5J5D9_9BACI|nr:FixH family protein [Bacillus sp. 31A1R]MDZ5474634.1 FixH family protein [Bacillus sp. 31A1R]